MTNDEEATTGLAAFREQDLSDVKVFRKIVFYAKSQRDCGAASAVGAGTVAISLLVGGVNVAFNAFYVLVSVQAILIYLGQFFGMRSAQLMRRDTSRGIVALFAVAATVVSGLSVYLTYQLKAHGAIVGSQSWWWLLGLAGVGALLGLIIRREAESLLDELDDIVWKLRSARLADKEQVEQVRERVTEVLVMQIRFMQIQFPGVFTSKPRVPGERATSAGSTRPESTSSGPTPPGPEDRANSEAVISPSLAKADPGCKPTLITSVTPSEVRPARPKRVPRIRPRDCLDTNRAPRRSSCTKPTWHTRRGGRNCSTRPVRPIANSAGRGPGGFPTPKFCASPSAWTRF